MTTVKLSQELVRGWSFFHVIDNDHIDARILRRQSQP